MHRQNTIFVFDIYRNGDLDCIPFIKLWIMYRNHDDDEGDKGNENEFGHLQKIFLMLCP